MKNKKTNKRRILSGLLLAAALAGLTGCFTGQITYPAYYTPAEQDQKIFFCRPYTNRKMWYVIGNSFGINRPGIPEVFPEQNRFYRIQERKTPVDLLITVLLGTFTSVTRSTLFIEECRVRGEKGFLDKDLPKDKKPGTGKTKAKSQP